MSSGFLLIVLTVLDGGNLSAAFVNTDSLAECERRSAIVQSILTESRSPFKQLVCRRSAARFEPFAHGMPADSPRWSYLVEIGAETAVVSDIADCADATSEVEGRFCVTSTQQRVGSAEQ